MTGLVALPTLDAFGRTGFGAFLRVVTFLLAILASMGVDALFGAVASTVAFFAAVDALYSRCHRHMLGLVLLTML